MFEKIWERGMYVTFVQDAQRRHFVTRCDVLNLSRKINHLSKVRHENDAQSVEQLVAEFRQEEYDPILIYKRQGSSDPEYPMFEAESFVVAFQTEFQKSLFETFAPSIICIDSTHKTNCHAFKLITVIVPDEFGEGK